MDKTAAGIWAILIVLFAFPASSSVAETENYEAHYVQTHGSWVTNRLTDTFDDSSVAWFAFAKQGDHGSIRLFCARAENNRAGYGLLAYADNRFIQTLGKVFEQTVPIKVRIKVDSNDIITTYGEYPNTLAQDSQADEVIKQMRRGHEIRIRTVHGDEQHTFIAKLNGFSAASDWVMKSCGVSFQR